MADHSINVPQFRGNSLGELLVQNTGSESLDRNSEFEDEDLVDEENGGEDDDDDDDENLEEEDEAIANANLHETYADKLNKVELEGLSDIGSLALWKLSSHKPGCGLHQLRDDNPETFWQSDGAQPHHITIHFNKRVQIEQVAIFTYYPFDESYTPSKIKVMAGSGLHDIKEVTAIEVNQPSGWCNISFENSRHDGVLKTIFLKIIIEANHHNGKDTHVRALKVFTLAYAKSNFKKLETDDLKKMSSSIDFSSIKFISESTIR